jgi:hypothetical protein
MNHWKLIGLFQASQSCCIISVSMKDYLNRSRISKVLIVFYKNLNLTLALGTTLLRPRWMQAADSSGSPPSDPCSRMTFSGPIPRKLEAVTCDQCKAAPFSNKPNNNTQRLKFETTFGQQFSLLPGTTSITSPDPFLAGAMAVR